VVSGPGAEVFAQRWSGSIQWIAESPLRPRHKRKNWFIAVMALPPALGPPASLDPSEVRFESFRAGGPGGQHQNKTESAVHVPSRLAAVARDGRSQHRNKAVVLERLAMLLRASQDIAAIADQHAVHSKHDRLERGTRSGASGGGRLRLYSTQGGEAALRVGSVLSPGAYAQPG
jgi:peptide chain release factor